MSQVIDAHREHIDKLTEINKAQAFEILALREQRDKLLAGCKTVMEHDGMCMYGCPEMIDKTKDEQKAFRLGSAMSYAECANEVRDVIFEVEGEK